MERIIFEDGVEIYKTNINSIELQNRAVTDSLEFLSKAEWMPQDNYTYMGDWGSFNYEADMKPHNAIEEIIRFGILKCAELEKSFSKKFNKVNANSWVNVVKAGNPKQNNFKKGELATLHNHVDLQKMVNSFYPTYTFVYYVQMPNNLSDTEGTLIIGGSNDIRYYHLPKEGDLIIMSGYLPHSPNRSPNSTKNRIVIAGNVGFENAKNQISLI